MLSKIRISFPFVGETGHQGIALSKQLWIKPECIGLPGRAHHFRYRRNM